MLQEADKRLGARPAALPRNVIREETGLSVSPAGGGADSLENHENSLLISKNITPQGFHFIDLPGFEPHGALVANLKAPLGDLRICGLHLGLRRRDRLRQMEALQDHLNTLTNRPTILAGDFNEWSRNKGMEPLTDYTILTPGHSFHAAHSIAHLDHIAHCNAWHLHSAGVIDNPLARRASDHLPIWADFSTAFPQVAPI